MYQIYVHNHGWLMNVIGKHQKIRLEYSQVRTFAKIFREVDSKQLENVRYWLEHNTGSNYDLYRLN